MGMSMGLLKIDYKKLENAIGKSQEYLLSRQHSAGYWAGLLEADVSVVAGFIPLMRILGIRSTKREQKAYNYLIQRQNKDGSWSFFWKGEGSLDVTVQSYFCLKMMGVSPRKEFMCRARNFILLKGGIEDTNTYTKIILALFGQYPWAALPKIPPEIIFLPKWFYINIYDFASWTRATIVAFSAILTLKPVFCIPEEENIIELYINENNFKSGVPFRAKKPASIENLFIALNRAIGLFEKMSMSLKISRKKALKSVEEWILEHQEEDGSWGGIMLPWLFSLIALKCLGYDMDEPVMKKGIKGLEDFIIEDTNTLVLQPATSPIWDTAWTLIALRESGLDKSDKSLKKSAWWLLNKQIKTHGDWKIKNPKTRPGCWSFEFENRFYPDIDDTAIVCCALNSVKLQNEEEKNDAVKAGIRWILDMQNSNGSWAAFDRNNHKKLLRYIPYADFITPLDFGSPDITAHVIYVLGKLKSDLDQEFLRTNDFLKRITRGFNYLAKSQKDDGSWYGRWGVNYLYGTSKVMQSFGEIERIILIDSFKQRILKAKNWLESCINHDGGWGESCASYELDSYVPLKVSTASQTSWAVTGLLYMDRSSAGALSGINYLIETQKSDGSWDEEYFTGGGFPKAFYLKYELYKDYFPLLALGKYKSMILQEGKNIW